MLNFPPMFPKSIIFRNFSGPLHLAKADILGSTLRAFVGARWRKIGGTRTAPKCCKLQSSFTSHAFSSKKCLPLSGSGNKTHFCTYRCGRKQSMNMSANHDHSTGSQTRSCSGSCLPYSSRVSIDIDLVYPSLSHHRASHRARYTIFFLVRSCIAGSR